MGALILGLFIWAIWLEYRLHAEINEASSYFEGTGLSVRSLRDMGYQVSNETIEVIARWPKSDNHMTRMRLHEIIKPRGFPESDLLTPEQARSQAGKCGHLTEQGICAVAKLLQVTGRQETVFVLHPSGDTNKTIVIDTEVTPPQVRVEREMQVRVLRGVDHGNSCSREVFETNYVREWKEIYKQKIEERRRKQANHPALTPGDLEKDIADLNNQLSNDLSHTTNNRNGIRIPSYGYEGTFFFACPENE